VVSVAGVAEAMKEEECGDAEREAELRRKRREDEK